jgi:DNA polymerase-3 subunit delta'
LGQLAEHEVAGLLADYAPALREADRGRIARLSEGSIGTALTLAQETGIAIAALVDEALAGPVPAARAQAMADAVARAEDGFEIFFALLRSGLAAATRQAARLPAAANLAPRVAVWQEFGKREREVQNLNLDKRAAIIVALSQLHGI